MASGARLAGHGLRGRGDEVGLLAGLVTDVRAGRSRVLVVRGEPGVGKTALLDELAGLAAGCRVVRSAGVQSEMEFAFAGLHQLLAGMLDRLGRLPAPQREALRTAFGISAGPPPDRFLVALAVLGLLAEVAGEQPLVCVVDDQQWLDRASAQALGFAARRLAAEPVGLVFAARVPGEELAGLPELAVTGLAEGDARALLDSALASPIDVRVRDQVVAEAGGNPLALLELPRGMTPAELAGGFGLPGAGSLTGRIEDSFGRQLDALPGPARQLLLAAADPSGDTSLVWRAAEQLGLPVAEATTLAVEAGLAKFGTRVRFRHPLARSVTYRSASFPERQQVHRVLAEATDPQVNPDRRAWHRAQAADGPDEEVAAELERSADRAQARGGLAAAAAFLERSVLLTFDPGSNPSMITDGIAAEAPALRQAASLFAGDSVSAGDRLRWTYVALWPAIRLWDDDSYRAILARHLQLVRDAGALDRLPIDLRSAAVLAAWSGDFGAAASLIAESEVVCEATGARIAPYAALLLSGLRGSQAETIPLIDAAINEAGGRGQIVILARWVTAILYNGLGR
ncbi:MAG TPA: AAA family ATPase [Streptosporangiaceae bacterium]|nr:AAA family ATPase [Streptosporangiaceae bacterium]